MFDLFREKDANETAYKIAAQPDYPGWLNMINHNATTLWETWAYPESSPSQNHPMFGSIDEWFYRSLLGINNAAPGFKKIIIKPQPVADLSWAKGSYESISGQIVSEWKKEGNNFTLHVVVPPNTTATVFIGLSSRSADADPRSDAEASAVPRGDRARHDRRLRRRLTRGERRCVAPCHAPSRPLLFAAFVVAALAQPLRATAWQTTRARVEFKAVYAASAVGSFLDTILPARLGEASKVGVLRVTAGKRWPGFSRAGGSLLCAHLLEAIAFLAVGAAAAAFLPLPGWARWTMVGGFAFAAGLIAVAAILHRRLGRYLRRASTRFSRAQPRRLACLRVPA